MTVEIVTSADLDPIRAELARLRQEVQALQFQRSGLYIQKIYVIFTGKKQHV